MKYVYMATWYWQSNLGNITDENWYDVEDRPYNDGDFVEPRVRVFEYLEDAIKFYSVFGFEFTAEISDRGVNGWRCQFSAANPDKLFTTQIVIERISITK